MRAAFALILAALAAGVSVAAPAKLVYRIDQATARIEHHRLVITATGAVSTGGWANPRLRLHDASAPEASTLAVDFLATPPHRGATVAQVIVPVNARVAARLPHYGVVQVKIASQTNNVIVPIARLSGNR
ncbi:MAG: hypothetical protein KGJ49_10750 [Alphaproteobacteria bacterium]|nr:hypothetical protein [Alphaproteobacteria bacterium]